MKHLKLFALALVMLLALHLIACGDTPDDPAPKLTLDEQIAPGMTYAEVVELVGEEGTKSALASNIYFWNTGVVLKLCVWFTDEYRFEDAVVIRSERRNGISIEDGMTSEEIDALLCLKGRWNEQIPNACTWRSYRGRFIHCWFGEDGRLIRHELSATSLYVKKGDSRASINTMFMRAGEKVENARDLYRWPSAKEGEYVYVRFDSSYLDGSEYPYATEVFEDKDITIEIGMPISELYKLYGLGLPTKGEGMLYSRISDGTIALFETMLVNDVLVLKEYDLNAYDVVGMTLSDINELMGNEGVDASITVDMYKWDTKFEKDLYVWFDKDGVASRSEYATDIGITGQMYRDRLIEILGEPTYSRYRSDWWVTSDDYDYDIYVIYTTAPIFMEENEVLYVPKLDVYYGMTFDYVKQLIGSEPHDQFLSGEELNKLFYVWVVGDSGFELYVAFDENGACDMGFRPVK